MGGEAKRRGTFEERKAQAIAKREAAEAIRNEEQLKRAEADAAYLETLPKEKRKSIMTGRMHQAVFAAGLCLLGATSTSKARRMLGR